MTNDELNKLIAASLTVAAKPVSDLAPGRFRPIEGSIDAVMACYQLILKRLREDQSAEPDK
jgi:hypothetical protein